MIEVKTITEGVKNERTASLLESLRSAYPSLGANDVPTIPSSALFISRLLFLTYRTVKTVKHKTPATISEISIIRLTNSAFSTFPYITNSTTDTELLKKCISTVHHKEPVL